MAGETLGARPWLLIEVEPDPDDPADEDAMQLLVRAGAGIAGDSAIVAVLLMAVEALTGVSSAEYEAAIEAAQSEVPDL